MILNLAAPRIEKSIDARAGVNITHLRPIDFVPLCTIPALFVHGTLDDYVSMDHSLQLADKYGGPCATYSVESADHYSKRVDDVYRVSLLLLREMMSSTKWEPEEEPQGVRFVHEYFQKIYAALRKKLFRQ
jgi:fermentation-respiration switch protein FrsA (DUF1100 family)